MRSITLMLLFSFSFGSFNSMQAQTLSQLEDHRVFLPNGWNLTPVGNTLPLGDLPLNMVVSPSKKLIAVTNNGQSDQTIQLIDVAKQTVLDTILIGKAWFGLAFSKDEKLLYASGGNDNWIIRYAIENQKLNPKDTIRLGKPWPERISPAGIALDESKNLMYVVGKENGVFYVLDLNTKQVVRQFPMGGEGYSCLLSPDRKLVYITCWGCDKVAVFDAEKQTMAYSIAVGDNPNDLCLTKNGAYLFVANANDNSVSVIDCKKRIVVETLNAALYPNSPTGSTTNAVCLSEDEKTLYIANADNNCLAVFDVSTPGNSKSKGFIPTGWYPTCVREVKGNIFVANGKGLCSYANPKGPNPRKKTQQVSYKQSDNKPKEKVQYIGGLFRGAMSILPVPNAEQLSVYSQAVYHNTPYLQEQISIAAGKPGNPIPMRVGDASPIKHVFYIIKENRTYDQVLSDAPGGNGDTSLLLFGEKVTPNQHALCKEFVLLDNFYVNAEVSADGHNWSTGAYATDFLEKNWPTNYGGRGGDYNGEGTREVANNKEGFIWDFCKRYGVTYRTYGEFADDFKPNIPALKDHFCTHYSSWNESVPDTTRFVNWKRDFDSLLAKESVPQFNSLRFPNDHTEGLKVGRPTPSAHVADNDLAVGLLVEYLSKSKIWNESVVFILEDDAQGGPDHVDAHRSTAYVAGGFVKKGYVDHTMYSTTSMLRTMELILGLPPMTQHDAAATPMWNSFAETASHPAFQHKDNQIDLTEKNTAMNYWSEKSEEFDFRAEDRVPDRDLNEVLWVAVRGEHSICPAPKHAAFITISKEED